MIGNSVKSKQDDLLMGNISIFSRRTRRRQRQNRIGFVHTDNTIRVGRKLDIYVDSLVNIPIYLNIEDEFGKWKI